MKAKTKFRKMYDSFSKEGREDLVWRYWDQCLSLNVMHHEVMNDTDLGKKILVSLGYRDDV